MSRTILITGAAGFVGHHMVEHFLKNTKDKVIGIDSLTYAGTWDRLRDIDIWEPTSKGDNWDMFQTTAFMHPRFTPLVYDFRKPAQPNLVKELKDVTHVLHLGAESHVDHSISDPLRFVEANVIGTTNMLNIARELPNLELFAYFSTDEVFGPAPMDRVIMADYQSPGPHWKVCMMESGYTRKAADGSRESEWEFVGYREDDKHDPKNPYAATKSAAEQMVVSFANTYKLPCIITRQMNIFGERQHPEKFIPLCIAKALNGGDITVHSTPDKKSAGKRHYIHARNVADAHLFLLEKKPWSAVKEFPRTVPSYHVVGEIELDNLTLAKTINEYVGIIGEANGYKPVGISNFEMVDFHGSRPGHDLRYALDGAKMKGLGWQPPKTFHESLKGVITWTLNNQSWIKL